MPQGAAARKLPPPKDDSNRSSSNSQKRKQFPTPQAANDNSSNTPTLKGSPATAPGTRTLRGVGPSSPKLSPKPTGSASSSPVSKRSPQAKSHSVGPDAIARPVNQLQTAARLGADQQQSRRDSAPGSGQTREQMIADSNDTTSGSVLPGQYDPLQSSSAYGKQSTRAPGSAAEPAKADTESGGGQVQSDLERQRATQLQQGKMAATRQLASQSAADAGIPLAAGTAGATQSSGREAEASSPETSSQFFQAGQAPEGKASGQIQTAQKLASSVGAEKTAKALGTARKVQGNLQAAQKAAKAAKNFWNIIKAGELAAGISVFSLVILIITSNLQMINKYTFKNPLIPETYLVEDGAIICTDCAVCGSSCFTLFTSPVFIVILIGALVLLVAMLGMSQLLPLDLLGELF
jgi:hypothetical protein